ncbi:hypothetical protein [Nocardioides sp. ChNu-99]|uniref:hypothetical protein n=1 Tax=Nocardioides sp. ChNu-99 TaxID=2839897 RepID=UPI00240726D6|nr:hypothetical protein [Nocardioides sp. ChNu-99]MDF9715798.1 hypothetical protein [Nocardioides sp. ChNu-99]
MTSLLTRYARTVGRVHSAPLWLLVVFVVAVALVPVSTPVQVGLFLFVVLFFWLPLAVVLRREFRRGYDQEGARERLRRIEREHGARGGGRGEG